MRNTRVTGSTYFLKPEPRRRSRFLVSHCPWLSRRFFYTPLGRVSCWTVRSDSLKPDPDLWESGCALKGFSFRPHTSCATVSHTTLGQSSKAFSRHIIHYFFSPGVLWVCPRLKGRWEEQLCNLNFLCFHSCSVTHLYLPVGQNWEWEEFVQIPVARFWH